MRTRPQYLTGDIEIASVYHRLPEALAIVRGSRRVPSFRAGDLAVALLPRFVLQDAVEPCQGARTAAEVMIHSDDAAKLGIGDGSRVRMITSAASSLLHARQFYGLEHGLLISEGVWPDDAYPDRRGINTLTGADPIAPYYGGPLPFTMTRSGSRRPECPPDTSARPR